MSAAHSLRMPPASAGKTRPQSDADRLMKEIGSDKGFDPFPPDHYLCFLDEGFTISPKAHRVLAVIYEGTIRQKEAGRSARANLANGKPMTRAFIAAALGVTSVSAEIAELERAGFIRVDPRGHFWLRGKLVTQKRREGEDAQEAERETKGEDSPLNECERKFCTKYLPEYMWFHFQRLSENERQQVQQRILGVKGAYDRALREVTEQLREIRDQAQDRDLLAFGFTPRRHKKEEQPAASPIARLQLLVDFENLVQNPEHNSVQEQEEILYTASNGSVHNSPPYSSSENRDTEKDLSADPERETEKEGGWVSEEEPPTHSQNELAATLEQAGFPVAPDDTLLDQFENLAAEHQIPVRSVCRAIAAKVAQKQAKGQTIFSAGALYGFVKTDLRLWIAQNNRAIVEDSPPIRSQAEDPEEFEQYLRNMQAKLADPETGDEEKKILVRIPLDVNKSSGGSE